MNRPCFRRPSFLFFTTCLAVWACLSAPTPALSQQADPEKRGLNIALDARTRGVGFGDFTARQTMVLRNRGGQESRRQLRLQVLEVPGDGDKNLFVFDEPRDVKGTALLIHAHREKEDEQWIYLPALRRVKRISSSNRSGSFMGSEFAYEDMGTPEVEKFTYRYLREEPCGDLTCTVSERIPVDPRSGYSRQEVWQDQKELRVWKAHYYDRKNAHLKTLTVADYRQYLDRYWYASEMTMVNHITGKSTTLTWTELQFQNNLNGNDFTRTGLRRIR